MHVAEEENIAVPELWQPTRGNLNFRRHVPRVARSIINAHGSIHKSASGFGGSFGPCYIEDSCCSTALIPIYTLRGSCGLDSFVALESKSLGQSLRRREDDAHEPKNTDR